MRLAELARNKRRVTPILQAADSAEQISDDEEKALREVLDLLRKGHDLRNPLAAISASAALLSVSENPSRRALAVLQRQVGHMTHLVNELLDITRVKHGRLQLERTAVELNGCILAAVETHRPRAEAKGLKLEHNEPVAPVYVDADSERLMQISTTCWAMR